MTELLFYDDNSLTDFEAEIVSIEHDGNRASVILNRTAFYPEGGGQPADRGTIGGQNVIDVRKSNGMVTHTVEIAAGESIDTAGSSVHCSVDFDHRFDYMQQHSGQHIISAAMMRLYEIKTVSVHQGEEYTAIETSEEDIPVQKLLEIEQESNRFVRSGTEIKSIWTDSDGLGDFSLRRPSKHSGSIRIIDIPGIDCVACGGIHLSSTSDAELIKYSHQEKIRGHIRTFWKIGRRAFADYTEKTVIINSLNEFYSARQFELVEKAKAAADSYTELKSGYGKLEEEYSALFASILAAEAEKSSTEYPCPIIKVFDDREKGFISGLLKALTVRTGTGPAFIFNRSGGVLTWAVACPSENQFDFGAFREKMLPLIAGKGGGRAPLWQGAAQNADGLDDLISALNAEYFRN